MPRPAAELRCCAQPNSCDAGTLLHSGSRCTEQLQSVNLPCYPRATELSCRRASDAWCLLPEMGRRPRIRRTAHVTIVTANRDGGN